MDGLFLLFGLSFVPINTGPYTNATIKVRDAALVESGIKTQWDTVAAAAEKKVPKALYLVPPAVRAVRSKEAVLRLSPAVLTIRPGAASAVFTWSF